MTTTGNGLEGRVVVVTGAARGIGAAAAKAIATAGGRLVLIDVHGEGLARVASECGASVELARVADVRDGAALAAVASAIASRGGAIDVLVNNAAVYAQGPLLELPEGAFERCVDVNLHGLVRCCRAFLPLLTRRPGGQIINVLSEFAWLPFPNKASYCVSKSAAAMASACLRGELAGRGVRVTDFVPPAVETGLVGEAPAVDPAAQAREVDVVRRHAIPAERVATALVGAIRRPRDRVVCGAMPRAAILAARLAPEFTRRWAFRAAVRMGLAKDG